MHIGSASNKSFQGLSIILNRRAERKKSARTKRGIRSVASNEPFFGTDTRWEPVLN